MNIEEYKNFIDSLSKEDLDEISYFNSTNLSYGKKFARATGKINRFEKYENPITTTENLAELQKILVQTCINYVKEHNLTDIYDISFTMDSVQDSVEYGEWCPSTDSHISACGVVKDDLDMFCERRIIGEYC